MKFINDIEQNYLLVKKICLFNFLLVIKSINKKTKHINNGKFARKRVAPYLIALNEYTHYLYCV